MLITDAELYHCNVQQVSLGFVSGVHLFVRTMQGGCHELVTMVHLLVLVLGRHNS